MAQNDIRIGDIGTVFEVTLFDDSTVLNISTASVKQIIFVDPDGSERAYDAEFTTDGTDGKLRYTTLVDNIYRGGNWQIRSKVVIAAGTFNSSHKNFIVRPN